MRFLNPAKLAAAAALSLIAGAVLHPLPYAAAASVVVVKMLDTPPSFDARTITIKAGDTVEWQNVGNAVHHATDDSQMAISNGDVASPKGAATFDSGFLTPGATFSHTFTTPGDYKYICAAHEASGMTGEIIVR